MEILFKTFHQNTPTEHWHSCDSCNAIINSLLWCLKLFSGQDRLILVWFLLCACPDQPRKKNRPTPVTEVCTIVLMLLWSDFAMVAIISVSLCFTVFEQSLIPVLQLLYIGGEADYRLVALGLGAVVFSTANPFSSRYGRWGQNHCCCKQGEGGFGGGCSLLLLLSMYCPNGSTFLTSCSLSLGAALLKLSNKAQGKWFHLEGSLPKLVLEPRDQQTS